MTFWTYILLCADGSYYVGHTDDLDNRLHQHDTGFGAAYTSSRRPVRLLWSQDCQSRDDAFQLERKIHGWSRAKKEALMRGDFAALPGLSRSKSGGARDEGASTGSA